MTRYARHIPYKVKRRIWDQPCIVCGSPWDSCVDHIVPVSKGGVNTEDNLQPLCQRCNYRKSNRRSNEELLAWVIETGRLHFYANACDFDQRSTTAFDRDRVEVWITGGSPLVKQAEQVYQAFWKKVAERA